MANYCYLIVCLWEFKKFIWNCTIAEIKYQSTECIRAHKFFHCKHFCLLSYSLRSNWPHFAFEKQHLSLVHLKHTALTDARTELNAKAAFQRNHASSHRSAIAVHLSHERKRKQQNIWKISNCKCNNVCYYIFIQLIKSIDFMVVHFIYMWINHSVFFILNVPICTT